MKNNTKLRRNKKLGRRKNPQEGKIRYPFDTLFFSINLIGLLLSENSCFSSSKCCCCFSSSKRYFFKQVRMLITIVATENSVFQYLLSFLLLFIFVLSSRNEFKKEEHCLLYFSILTPKAILTSIYDRKNVSLNQIELYLPWFPKTVKQSQSTVPTFMDLRFNIRQKTFLVVIFTNHKQGTVGSKVLTGFQKNSLPSSSIHD